MNKTYTFILAFLASLSCLPAWTLDLGRLSAYRSFEISYISVDTENRPVVLSALISYPTVSNTDATPAEAKFVVLHNHPTATEDSGCATGSRPVDYVQGVAERGIMQLAASDYALVVSCDYLGYGVSRDRVHPYCNHTLTARNVLDGFLAALDIVRQRGLPLSDDYYTYNVGYSQGGGVSMAVQYFLECCATQAEKDAFRLRRTVAGAGPYDLELMFDELCRDENLEYAIALPFTLEGLFDAYKEGCFKQIDPYTYYRSPALRDKVREAFRTKNMSTGAISSMISNFVGRTNVRVEDIFNENILNGPAARALRKALHKNNLLSGEWIPETPLVLYHFTGDRVVYFANATKAKEVFGSQATLYTDHQLDGKLPFLVKVLLSSMGTPSESHSGYGTYFFAYFLSGAFTGGSL